MYGSRQVLAVLLVLPGALAAQEPLDPMIAAAMRANDPDSGATIFEHRESLLFQPTHDMWRAVLSQPPASHSSEAAGP